MLKLLVRRNWNYFINPHRSDVVRTSVPLKTLIVKTKIKRILKGRLAVTTSLPIDEVFRAMLALSKSKYISASINPRLGRIDMYEILEEVGGAYKPLLINDLVICKIQSDAQLRWLLENFIDLQQLGLYIYDKDVEEVAFILKELIIKPDDLLINKACKLISYFLSFDYDGNVMYIQTIINNIERLCRHLSDLLDIEYTEENRIRSNNQ